MIPLQNGVIVLLEKEKATLFESGLSLLHANYQESNGEVCPYAVSVLGRCTDTR